MDTNLTLLVTAYHNTLVGDKDTPLRVPLKPGTDEGVCVKICSLAYNGGWILTLQGEGAGHGEGTER